ncbi:hypothetical protein BdPhPhi1402_gp26 [Bdellovibrio phage phi1402]|uniref:hypothetical protein n=1 Tax=Bdellovibrio phage phi1402 TaxID=1035662 RepID=UPI000211A2D8|nr:hypothetical protein BdPhPhi1402_gp26 [Bdellovibrio phage phi1402]AEG42323.1 hypothetical protein [Bdellovibrio phage phi1402]
MDPNLFNWFLIFNRVEFDETELVSRTYSVTLDGIGDKDILVTRGNILSMTYDGVMVGLDTDSPADAPFSAPFIFDNVGIMQTTNGDVYLGLPK